MTAAKSVFLSSLRTDGVGEIFFYVLKPLKETQFWISVQREIKCTLVHTVFKISLKLKKIKTASALNQFYSCHKLRYLTSFYVIITQWSMINVNNTLCSIKHTPRTAKQWKLDRKHKFLDSHPFMMDCQFC